MQRVARVRLRLLRMCLGDGLGLVLKGFVHITGDLSKSLHLQTPQLVACSVDDEMN